MAGIVLVLLGVWRVSQANSEPAAISPEEQERRRSFVNYQMSQEMAARREAFREVQAQWWQQQPPPPRDPSTWGGGDGGRFR